MHASKLKNSNNHTSWNNRQHLNSKVLNCRSHTIHVFPLSVFIDYAEQRETKAHTHTHTFICISELAKKKVDKKKEIATKQRLKDMAHETKPHRKLNNNKSVSESTSIEFMQWKWNETTHKFSISIENRYEAICSLCLHLGLLCQLTPSSMLLLLCRHAFAHTHPKIQMNLHIICKRCYFTWSISRAMTHLTYFFLSLLCIFSCAWANFVPSLLALKHFAWL